MKIFENSIRVFVLFGADTNRTYHLPAVIADCVGGLEIKIQGVLPGAGYAQSEAGVRRQLKVSY
jgi:hypothetical protein